MSRLIALVAATLGSAFGWWVGSWVGVMTAFFLSVVGTAAGIYFGNRLAKEYFTY